MVIVEVVVLLQVVFVVLTLLVVNRSIERAAEKKIPLVALKGSSNIQSRKTLNSIISLGIGFGFWP